MEDKIKTLKSEIDKLEKQASKSSIVNDPQKIKSISQKLTTKKEKLAILEEKFDIQTQIKEAESIIDEEDEELVQLANEELTSLKNQLKQIEEKQKKQKHAKTDKIKNCIIEIRAGTGGEEANLFAADLFRMYTQYIESKGWKIFVLSKNQTGTGGFKELIAQVKGKGSYTKLQYENGVHRVQRIPTTESSGRIHTSAASVVVYPLMEQTDINIDPSDLKFDVYRASGPGGQSVNTTDSAVRVTHVPTGTIVTCQDEKSQHKNKKKALSILASRLEAQREQEHQEEVDDIRRQAIKTGDRSAKIRTYNYPQNRVTDHRIKESWHNLTAIIDGDLDPVVNSLLDYE